RKTSSISPLALSRVSPGPSRTASRRVARAGSAWPSEAWAAAVAKREVGSAASAARRALASRTATSGAGSTGRGRSIASGGGARAGAQARHPGVGLDRAEQLDRLGRAALAQGQVGQAGPGGQVVGVLVQDLAPAGGRLGGVGGGRRGGGPGGAAGGEGRGARCPPRPRRRRRRTGPPRPLRPCGPRRTPSPPGCLGPGRPWPAAGSG